MASPVDANRIGSGGSTSGTGLGTISLPSGLQSGDLILLIVDIDGTNYNSRPPGFTQLGGDIVGSVHLKASVYYKQSDGTETTTTVSGNVSTKWSAVAWRITGWDSAVAPEQVNTNSSGTTPDPPSITPAGGANDYLYVWAGACQNQPTMPPTGSPTGYSNTVGVQSGGSGGAASKNCCFGASKQTTGSTTEDPSSWTISVSGEWGAVVFAVSPPVTPPPPVLLPPNTIRALRWLGG